MGKKYLLSVNEGVKIKTEFIDFAHCRSSPVKASGRCAAIMVFTGVPAEPRSTAAREPSYNIVAGGIIGL